MSKRRLRKAEKRREAPRKPERSYARSISLREDQIRRLEEAGVTSMSKLFQGLVDEWLSARDKGEAIRLREQANLLITKAWSLPDGPERQECARKANEMNDKAEKIEWQIKDDERKRHEAESEKARREAARYH